MTPDQEERVVKAPKEIADNSQRYGFFRFIGWLFIVINLVAIAEALATIAAK